MNATDDWYDVERLPEGYRICEADDYNVYLLPGEERALLVDAALGVGDLRGLAADLVDVPVTVLLSHTHWDHIGAASQFDDVRVHPRELFDGRVSLTGLTDEFARRPAEFVETWREGGGEFPDGFDPGSYTLAPADAEPIEPGDEIDLGGRSLEVVGAPGHSPGHAVALERDRGVLYGGDALHFDRGLYVHFDDCDLEAYADTMARLRDLHAGGAFDTLYTCHNPPIAGDDLSVLGDLAEGLRAILAGELDYETVETRYGEARRYEIDGSEVLTKPDPG